METAESAEQNLSESQGEPTESLNLCEPLDGAFCGWMAPPAPVCTDNLRYVMVPLQALMYM